MIDFFVKFYNWFVEQWKPVFKFFSDNRNSPLLWIGLFVVGFLIFKITYEMLNKNNQQ